MMIKVMRMVERARFVEKHDREGTNCYFFNSPALFDLKKRSV